MSDPVIVSKVANALFQDANGGGRVGGRLTLTTATLQFHPNGVNRLANSGPLDVEIDLRDLTGPVTVLPGFLTKIIAVPVGGEIFKARCWGAAAMAERIQTAANAAQSAGGTEPEAPQ